MSVPVFDEKAFKRKVLGHKIRQIIDNILPKIFLVFAVLWFLQSVVTMIVANSMFTPIHLWLAGLTMHATTSLNLTAIYLVSYLYFRVFQLGHMRVVRALMFTVLGVVFYDTIWAICNYAINGSGSFILPLTSTFVIVFYMIIIHRQQKILSFDWRRIAPTLAFYVFTLVLFVYSGFFQQWGLYEQGLASDPTGYIWLLNKAASLWLWVAFELR